MSEKAAIYIRLSKKKRDSDPHGFAEQLEKCKLLLSKKEWSLYRVYTDRVSSLSSLVERKELTQLLRDGEQKLFQHVIFYSLDRLGKITEDILHIANNLQKLKLGILSCSEVLYCSAQGELNLTFLTGTIHYMKRLRMERKLNYKNEMDSKDRIIALQSELIAMMSDTKHSDVNRIFIIKEQIEKMIKEEYGGV